ncbi:putative glucose-methanol-choline oxidoreductase [Cryphonectria parasitica EP155]|uniref:Glucose-methanol-choline oxidoreductase n=1 Tax=Cryphonectria parasitica (strain ATCC 38755 / EP155) TaxID=660469 RepID=A0A9P5CME9_CRYP1|nr:putative glucose-methanol-choline oxidoreductase [Cryphonectria parasitica EP155]KAF3763011.1 putative glucose-methanol-choline oxidoreductase [Cryphonectria parasitica EP155]
MPVPILAAPTVPESDYLIIGGGPAGFVVAEYLSRDPSKSVLLLEAGPDGDADPEITTPAEFFATSNYMWRYATQPDAGLGGLSANLFQGKAFGGGTAVNAMLYARGAASVYDDWAEISGNEGLGWDSMLEAFKATTQWQVAPEANYSQAINVSMFGDGPLAISRQRKLLTFDEPFSNEVQTTFDLNQIDFVSGEGIGVSQGIESIRVSNETRSYAYNTFGYLANTRNNFQALHNAWVSNIGFSNKTANSVTYNDTLTNTTYVRRAKEIILAAGAINTPQLLMLSGVGPAQRLIELDIPVIQDIAEVGQNLQDHHYATVEYEAKDFVDTYWQLTENATREAIEAQEYAANGDGLFGTIVGDVLAMIRLPDEVASGYQKSLPQDRPHVAFTYFAGPFLPGSPNVSMLSAFAAVVQPEVFGSVDLASADYRDAPLIYANYWASEGDKSAVIYAYRKLRDMFRSPQLSGYTKQEVFPGANYTDSDADLWSAIQKGSSSWHHPVGTTAIGTVLDANWRVKGLKGLRIVGSSAAPTITTCPTQGMVYAIALRAAMDIAKADGLEI